ncbi:hypothetical protein [Streptomyces chromofuscus]|uniref:hypothetical protein n=1 Tax=Streptomyces chromofuscus TaxID=42881 RepID=UPI0016781FE9|nr:hypothetical protein [Streptomyces chromofuscus]GGT04748.1 hypothetical protein GCM10010254_26570 [Streptomyces chromofuscus]
MTTLAQLRKAALALPEVEEGTHLGMAAFSVRGRGFASVTKSGHVQLRLPEHEIEAAVAAHSSGERLVRNGAAVAFRVPLADIDGKELNALVRTSWFSRAPKRLAASLAAAEASADSPGVDLPAGIGKPAGRALLGAGLTTLEQVAQRTASELLALHGVGPKAMRVLSEALGQRGLALRE